MRRSQRSRPLFLPLSLAASVLSLAPAPGAQAAGDRYPDGRGGELYFPMGAVSFADEAVRFDAGDPAADDAQYSEAERALGPPRYAQDADDYITLGCAGELVLRFDDNQPIDVPGPDLYVFEIGPDTEPTALAVSEDGDAWTRVRTIAGGKAEIDLAPYLAPYVAADASFRLVKLVDLKRACNSGTPGADVDAVGAIRFGHPHRPWTAPCSSIPAPISSSPAAYAALDAIIARIADPASVRWKSPGIPTASARRRTTWSCRASARRRWPAVYGTTETSLPMQRRPGPSVKRGRWPTTTLPRGRPEPARGTDGARHANNQVRTGGGRDSRSMGWYRGPQRRSHPGVASRGRCRSR